MELAWDQLLTRNPEVARRTEPPKLRRGSCSVVKMTGHQVEGRTWAKSWKMGRWTQRNTVDSILGAEQWVLWNHQPVRARRERVNWERKGLCCPHQGVDIDPKCTRRVIHKSFWQLVNEIEIKNPHIKILLQYHSPMCICRISPTTLHTFNMENNITHTV